MYVIRTYKNTHTYIHNGWLLDFKDIRLLGKLAIPVCRHLLRHICIVFTQHPQSQLVVYTTIIAEQTIITVSKRVYISVWSKLNKTGTLKPSVTIICDIVLDQPPTGFQTVSTFPISLTWFGWTRGIWFSDTLSMVPQYSVVTNIMKISPPRPDSNPDRSGENQTC